MEAAGKAKQGEYTGSAACVARDGRTPRASPAPCLCRAVPCHLQTLGVASPVS